jgi:hypothetical protein
MDASRLGESTLRKIAREAIQAGRLPSSLPKRMWGGPGVGACCTICGRVAAGGGCRRRALPLVRRVSPANRRLRLCIYGRFRIEHVQPLIAVLRPCGRHGGIVVVLL